MNQQHLRTWLTDRRIWFRLMRVAAIAFPTFFISKVFLALGDAGLWLPADWTAGGSFLAATLGSCLFEYVRVRPLGTNVDMSEPRISSAVKRTQEERSLRKRSDYRRAIYYLLGAIVLFIAYSGIRSACVYSWPGAHEWIRHTYGNDISDASSGWANFVAEVPTFIDHERSKILIPAWILRPPELRQYFALIRTDPANAGLVDPVRLVLEKEPDRIIDSLDGSGSMYLHAQSISLFVVYIGIIGLVAVSLGLTFRSENAVADLVAGAVS